MKTINITEKTGDLISLKNVNDLEDLMVINKSGIVIRIGVDTLRVMGRATQGVKIIRLKDDDSIASVAKVSKTEDDVEDSDKSDTEQAADNLDNQDLENNTSISDDTIEE